MILQHLLRSLLRLLGWVDCEWCGAKAAMTCSKSRRRREDGLWEYERKECSRCGGQKLSCSRVP